MRFPHGFDNFYEGGDLVFFKIFFVIIIAESLSLSRAFVAERVYRIVYFLRRVDDDGDGVHSIIIVDYIIFVGLGWAT